MNDDTRDKVIRLEEQLSALTRTVDKMAGQVEIMSNLLQQARGAKWVIVGSAGVAGFLAGKVGALAGFFGMGR